MPSAWCTSAKFGNVDTDGSCDERSRQKSCSLNARFFICCQDGCVDWSGRKPSSEFHNCSSFLIYRFSRRTGSDNISSNPSRYYLFHINKALGLMGPHKSFPFCLSSFQFRDHGFYLFIFIIWRQAGYIFHSRWHRSKHPFQWDFWHFGEGGIIAFQGHCPVQRLLAILSPINLDGVCTSIPCNIYFQWGLLISPYLFVMHILGMVANLGDRVSCEWLDLGPVLSYMHRLWPGGFWRECMGHKSRLCLMQDTRVVIRWFLMRMHRP